jgi:hypothetical protein
MDSMYKVAVMRVDIKVKKQLDEARYLSTENTWRYRTIIRAMYNNYENLKRKKVILIITIQVGLYASHY